MSERNVCEFSGQRVRWSVCVVVVVSCCYSLTHTRAHAHTACDGNCLTCNGAAATCTSCKSFTSPGSYLSGSVCLRKRVFADFRVLLLFVVVCCWFVVVVAVVFLTCTALSVFIRVSAWLCVQLVSLLAGLARVRVRVPSAYHVLPARLTPT